MARDISGFEIFFQSVIFILWMLRFKVKVDYNIKNKGAANLAALLFEITIIKNIYSSITRAEILKIHHIQKSQHTFLLRS